MAKLSKRARLIREKVDVLKDYDIAEAITLCEKSGTNPNKMIEALSGGWLW